MKSRQDTKNTKNLIEHKNTKVEEVCSILEKTFENRSQGNLLMDLKEMLPGGQNIANVPDLLRNQLIFKARRTTEE